MKILKEVKVNGITITAYQDQWGIRVTSFNGIEWTEDIPCYNLETALNEVKSLEAIAKI